MHGESSSISSSVARSTRSACSSAERPGRISPCCAKLGAGASWESNWLGRAGAEGRLAPAEWRNRAGVAEWFQESSEEVRHSRSRATRPASDGFDYAFLRDFVATVAAGLPGLHRPMRAMPSSRASHEREPRGSAAQVRHTRLSLSRTFRSSNRDHGGITSRQQSPGGAIWRNVTEYMLAATAITIPDLLADAGKTREDVVRRWPAYAKTVASLGTKYAPHARLYHGHPRPPVGGA